MKIYLIGSLRNPRVPEIANELRLAGYEVFDDWFAAGPEADDRWRSYSLTRGQTYREALRDYAAQHTYWFDHKHLESCDVAVLVSPAGRSGYFELGYILGKGRPIFILQESGDPERWDVMMAQATICEGIAELTRKVHAYAV